MLRFVGGYKEVHLLLSLLLHVFEIVRKKKKLTRQVICVMSNQQINKCTHWNK
jgi:hypothetical protein